MFNKIAGPAIFFGVFCIFLDVLNDFRFFRLTIVLYHCPSDVLLLYLILRCAFVASQ